MKLQELELKSDDGSRSVLAVGGNVGEDPEQKLSLQARIECCGYDDVAPLRQGDAQEDGPGVDVGASSHLLLGDVHPVVPVQLHLIRDTTRFRRFVNESKACKGFELF